MSPALKAWGNSTWRNFSSSATVIFAIAMSLPPALGPEVLLQELADVISKKENYHHPGRLLHQGEDPPEWISSGYFNDRQARTCHHTTTANSPARDAGQHQRAHAQPSRRPQQPLGRPDRRAACNAWGNS